MRRRGSRWTPERRRTAVIGGAAAVTAIGAFAAELSRVWRRGSAPMPADADSVVEAAVEAAVETTDVAVAGYQLASAEENALFNLFASFVISLVSSRAIAYGLRGRRRLGPFRNVRVGRRHIHHFVPGIVLGLGAGGTAIAVRGEHLDRWLALPFGAGAALVLDEAALLLELEDVYWNERGVLSLQLSFGAIALLASLALSVRLLRRGETFVLPQPAAAAPAR